MGILIRKPGASTTVQDFGRYGHQAEGVSPAGVMDRRSAAKANLLVDNPEEEAVLEVMLGGLEILFETDNVAAVCGAEIPVLLDGMPMQREKAVTIRAGQVLSIGYAVKGVYLYVAFAGGLQLRAVMESRSTHVQSGVGGMEGRRLKQGDRIGFRKPVAGIANQAGHVLSAENWPAPGQTVVIRAIPGPQEEHFSEEGKQRFWQKEYLVSSQSNRMGYRLDCAEESEETCGEDLYSEKQTGITDGVVFGAVQIPPSGLPIVMMADRQTTGGYPKIAVVISDDLPLLAQCAPGVGIRFSPVSVESAQQLLQERKKELLHIAGSFRAERCRQEQNFRIHVNGRSYDVTVH